MALQRSVSSSAILTVPRAGHGCRGTFLASIAARVQAALGGRRYSMALPVRQSIAGNVMAVQMFRSGPLYTYKVHQRVDQRTDIAAAHYIVTRQGET